MSTLTPQIEAILRDLTDWVSDSLAGKSKPTDERIDALTESLATNGWMRHQPAQGTLSDAIERRVRDQSRLDVMNRGAALRGLLNRIQESYDRYSDMRSSVPNQQLPIGERPENQPHPPVTTLGGNSASQ
ncbi:hypothetical protein [Aureliella helgolandensis]|uniref:hypothetical protein n=1 Tax=Aureliella helgolandensis TaxID=2527968 RepID=UPI0011A5C35E|nr:hypothetical protein [Aureliella helgolandensis]